MDPKTGMIDINILTTGLSISDRKRRIEASKALMDVIKSKGKITTIGYHTLFEAFKDTSDTPISRSLFDDALKVLMDDDKLSMGDDRKMIRIC